MRHQHAGRRPGDERVQKIRLQDNEALARAEQDGYLVRPSTKHGGHAVYEQRCRQAGRPCVCVHMRRSLADVTLEMPRGPAGWVLDEAARKQAESLIQETPCPAYTVGPRWIAVCRVPALQAPEIARRLHELALGCRPHQENPAR